MLIPLEYALALLTLALLIPLIVAAKRVAVVHTANPPDFIIPAVAWLKMFGIKLVYDVHDVSEETLRGKFADAGLAFQVFAKPIRWLERISIAWSDLVIATNLSISRRVAALSPGKRIVVVRNSNPLVYRRVEDIAKAPGTGLNVGYFGVLANDRAAGLDNILTVARVLANRGVPFSFSIVGRRPRPAALWNRWLRQPYMTDPLRVPRIHSHPAGLSAHPSVRLRIRLLGRHPQEQPAHRHESHGLHVLRGAGSFAAAH